MRHPSGREEREGEGGRSSSEGGVSQVGSIDGDGGSAAVYVWAAAAATAATKWRRGDWGEQNKQLPRFWICVV